MNREIKFRLWAVFSKEMFSPDEDESFVDGTPVFPPNTIAMQFTGLKDKNGKEIYEGDIVKIGEDLIEEIKWVDETNWMGEKCPVNGWVNHQSIYKQPVEVIGNIYENPELLTTA